MLAWERRVYPALDYLFLRREAEGAEGSGASRAADRIGIADVIVRFDTPRRVDGLVLRPWGTGDERALLSIYGDPEVMRHVSAPPITTTADATAVLAVWGAARDPRVGFYAVECATSGEVVGSVLFSRPFAELATVASSFTEVSWHVRRDQWGQGIAPAAARAAIDAVGADRILAQIDPSNAASVSVARKLHMSHRGIVLGFKTTRELWITAR